VRDLVAEYADVFALAISEVFPVAGAVYALKIPPEKTFSTKIQQRPLSRLQAEYLHKQVEVLERVGVIQPFTLETSNVCRRSNWLRRNTTEAD
jgi:hypothetical protein